MFHSYFDTTRGELQFHSGFMVPITRVNDVNGVYQTSNITSTGIGSVGIGSVGQSLQAPQRRCGPGAADATTRAEASGGRGTRWWFMVLITMVYGCL